MYFMHLQQFQRMRYYLFLACSYKSIGNKQPVMDIAGFFFCVKSPWGGGGGGGGGTLIDLLIITSLSVILQHLAIIDVNYIK